MPHFLLTFGDARDGGQPPCAILLTDTFAGTAVLAGSQAQLGTARVSRNCHRAPWTARCDIGSQCANPRPRTRSQRPTVALAQGSTRNEEAESPALPLQHGRPMPARIGQLAKGGGPKNSMQSGHKQQHVPFWTRFHGANRFNSFAGLSLIEPKRLSGRCCTRQGFQRPQREERPTISRQRSWLCRAQQPGSRAGLHSIAVARWGPGILETRHRSR
jgi:hypothetical protein